MIEKPKRKVIEMEGAVTLNVSQMSQLGLSPPQEEPQFLTENWRLIGESDWLSNDRIDDFMVIAVAAPVSDDPGAADTEEGLYVVNLGSSRTREVCCLSASSIESGELANKKHGKINLENGRLIAVAPKMFRALQQLSALWPDDMSDIIAHDSETRACAAAREVIAEVLEVK